MGRKAKKKGKYMHTWGFPGGTSGKELACQFRRCKKHSFNPQVRKIPRVGNPLWYSRNGNPLQYSMDRGAWQAIVHGVARHMTEHTHTHTHTYSYS